VTDRAGQTWQFNDSEVVFVVTRTSSKTSAEGERLIDHDILILIGGSLGGGKGAGPWAKSFTAGEEGQVREYGSEPWHGKKGKRKLLTRIA
jgi:hypothetical protein